MLSDAQIEHNKRVHDAVATSYEALHKEIYNPTEQVRICDALTAAIAAIQAPSQPPTVLDFGAGTENLTGHLLKAGAAVSAGDVSPRSLEHLKARFGASMNIALFELNGRDLEGIPDNAFDMVATYSVLHHVPDYLTAVRDFMRVVKPGGVIFIGQAAAPVIWEREEAAYQEYPATLDTAYGPSRAARITRKLFNIFSYRAWFRLINRKVHGLNEEGDIHVTKEDHIEWDKVEKILSERCEVLVRKDDLVCRETQDPPVFHGVYRERAVDIRLLVCRKR